MNYFYELLTIRRTPFIPIDDNGYLLTAYRNSRDLTCMERDVMSDFVPICKEIAKTNLISIYFRGNVTYENDDTRLDIVLVVHNTHGELTKKLSDAFHMQCDLKFPFIKILHVDIFPLKDLTKKRYSQFILKVLCLRIYGKAVERRIPKFKPGPELIYSCEIIESKLQALRNIAMTDRSSFKMASIHLAKHVVHAAFEVVSIEAKGYTRDLRQCFEWFIRFHPEYAKSLRQIYCYIEGSSIDPGTFISEVESFHQNLLDLAARKNLLVKS